jgi:hypothetical protein
MGPSRSGNPVAGTRSFDNWSPRTFLAVSRNTRDSPDYYIRSPGSSPALYNNRSIRAATDSIVPTNFDDFQQHSLESL